MAKFSHSHYDAIIIGAGMSGLAAGIRLAMYDKKVLILERHEAPGGLNSFYNLRGRRYDVGLHAMTNYVEAGKKGTPLGKIFRQLRISREEWDLSPQVQSRIAFPDISLTFTNDFEHLQAEIAQHFPQEMDGLSRLLVAMKEWDATSLQGKETSARGVIAEYLKDPLLIDMLLCPLMYYGSSRENDMDFSQFIIMFDALFHEGFARPFAGVRQVIRTLTKKFSALGGERKMNLGVKRLVVGNGNVSRLVLDDGTELTAEHVISSIGSVETARLCSDYAEELPIPEVGKLSFVETITTLSKQPRELGWEDTIIFFNDSQTFDYASPAQAIDLRSGVICFPNNYQYGEGRCLDEGFLRVTCLANYDVWNGFSESEYTAQKEVWYQKMQEQALRFLPTGNSMQLNALTLDKDMFTPTTVKRFTGHLRGAIYGATDKIKDGRTHVKNLYLCGTDQGFLGIVGAMLSGISMANFHVLQGK